MPQVGTIISETVAQIHAGPLPRADELDAYRQVDPSFAERIVQMAEREQVHRHAIDEAMVERDYRLKSRGQHYALAVATIILLFAALLAGLDDTDMAGKVALGTLVGAVSMFLGGRWIDRRAEETAAD